MSIGSFEVHQDLFKRWLALQSATHTHWHLQRSWLCKWMRCTFALKLRKLNRRFIACALNSSTSEILTTLFAASTIYNIPRSCTWCVYIYIYSNCDAQQSLRFELERPVHYIAHGGSIRLVGAHSVSPQSHIPRSRFTWASAWCGLPECRSQLYSLHRFRNGNIHVNLTHTYI